MLYPDILTEIEKSCQYVKEEIERVKKIRNSIDLFSRSDVTNADRYYYLFTRTPINNTFFNIEAEADAVSSIIDEKAGNFINTLKTQTEQVLTFFNLVHFIYTKYLGVSLVEGMLPEQHLRHFLKKFEEKYSNSVKK